TTINGVVPTPSLRAAMLATTPSYALLLNEFFLPNQPYSSTATTAQYIGAGVIPANDKHFEIKPDVLLTSNSRVTATWLRDRPDQIQPMGPEVDYNYHFNGAQDRVNLTFTTFRHAWVSETRFGWNRADDERLLSYYNIKDPNKSETIVGERRAPGIS